MTAAAATELVVVPREVPGELTVEQIVEQTLKVKQCMEKVMIDGEHYGVIPGTTQEGKPPKKVLLKPGAEKLCLLFRLDPEYDTVTSVETPSLIRFVIRCTLFHIPTGARVASGLGSCNSSEDKYMRSAPKKCPTCGKASIIKGSPQYGGGYVCWKKKDGCGAKFNDGAPEIEGQETGIKDPADLHNTILKMACKRALVAAVLNATAASDFFTQDLEDLTEKAAEYIPPPPKDDLKEKLEASIAQQAPEAAKAQEDKKFGKRFAKKTKGGEAPAPTAEATGSAPESSASSNADAAAEPAASSSTDMPRAAGDTGEPATAEQKDAIKSHMRKKGWKMSFVRIWFAELFGFPVNTPEPWEGLSQMQADAAHFLVLAHGTANYRKIRMEYADQGLVRRDENDITF
jgi:hypothetical protein